MILDMGARVRVAGRGAWPGLFWPLLTAVLLGLLLARLPLTVLLPLLAVTAVVILTLIEPLFGLGLTLLVAPLGALENVLLGAGSFDSGQALLLLTLAAWIGRGLARRRFALPQLPLTVPLVLYILLMLLTLPGARDLSLGLKEVLKWVEITAVMLLVVDLARGLPGPGGRSWRTGWIVAMLLLAGVSQAVIGLWQFGLRGEGPEHFLVLERFYRAAGTFEQPNPFGGYMNMSALLAGGVLLGLATFWWQRRRSAMPGRTGMAARNALLFLAVGLAFALASAGVLVSWSRGAWMGFAAGILVLFAFWPRKLAWAPMLLLLLAGLVLLVSAAGLLPTAVVERLAGFAADFSFGDVRGIDINDANYSVLERLAHWQAALAMAREEVWLGVGFGNYGAAYADYDLLNWPDALGHAHNLYLNLLAETGVIGLAAYLLLWGVIFYRTLRLLRAAWPVRGIVLGLLAVWTAFAVHHLVDKLYVNNIYIHLGVLLGLLELVGLQVDAAVRSGENKAEASA